MNSARLRAYIYLLIVALIWGVAGPVIKLTLKELPADIFIAYRFLISTLVALPFLFIRRLSFPKDKETFLQLLAYSLLNSTVSLGLLFWGTSRTSLLSMSLISLFGPLLLAAFGYFFLGDRVTTREKVGTFISFLGASFVVIGPLFKSNDGSGDIFGNLLIFLSLLAGATSGVLVKKLMRKGISADFLANISFTVGFLTLAPYTLIRNGLEGTLGVIKDAPIVYHLGVLYMAIFSGNIAYILNNLGQKTIELSEAAPFAYLYPAISAVLAIFLLGDRLTTQIVVGVVIAFSGVILAETKKKKYN